MKCVRYDVQCHWRKRQRCGSVQRQRSLDSGSSTLSDRSLIIEARSTIQKRCWISTASTDGGDRDQPNGPTWPYSFLVRKGASYLVYSVHRHPDPAPGNLRVSSSLWKSQRNRFRRMRQPQLQCQLPQQRDSRVNALYVGVSNYNWF